MIGWQKEKQRLVAPSVRPFFFFEKKSPSLSHGVLRSIIYSHVYYCYFRLGFGYVCVQSSHLVLLFLL